MSNSVAIQSDECALMVKCAELPRTLMRGTRGMREARENYLPREEAESPLAYENRLKRTFLFNAFAKTVGDMTGKVFAKPISLKDTVPPQIVDFAENIDQTGRHLNVFAHDVFHDGQVTGIGFILVDMPPPLTGKDGQPATILDEQQAKLRPYFVYIPIERVVGWQSTTVNGAETLTQFRFRECVSVPDGEFAERDVEQIKVLEPKGWRTFRKIEQGDATPNGAKVGDWALFAEGVSSLNKITVVPVYTKRTGFMTGEPPHEKLAELNVRHWQSQSDQCHILHIARVAILFWAGKTDDDNVMIGPNSFTFSRDPAAKLSYVEHSGEAIGSGDKDLQNIEAQMQAMGLQLLIDGPGGQSATGEIRDDSKENSPLAMMARSLGDAIEKALAFMADYMGIGDSNNAKRGGEVEINTDYGIQAGAGTDLQWLTQATAAGDLSRQAYWAELKRRGTLSDSFDPEVEKERLKEEAPVLPDPGPGKGMPLNPPPQP